MKKLNTKAGFTLAELLIVVAIIAILVAIGIPVFSTAMERSRETVDLANIRAAYAEFQSAQLSGNGVKGGVYKIDFKQTNGKGWLIDTTGLKNLLAPDAKATGAGATDPKTVYALDTPAVAGGDKDAVQFELVAGDGKPELTFVKYSDAVTGKAGTGDANVLLSDKEGTTAGTYVTTDATYFIYK